MSGSQGVFMRRDYRPADTSWHHQGACTKEDEALFYHPEGERGSARYARADAAKAICRGCPMRQLCREQSLAAREPYGTWGGLSEDERAALLAGRPIEGPMHNHPRPKATRARSGAPGLVLTRAPIPRTNKRVLIQGDHVVAHVQQLVAAGHKPTQIARTAGLVPMTVLEIAQGSSRITERVANLLLAVQPEAEVAA